MARIYKRRWWPILVGKVKSSALILVGKVKYFHLVTDNAGPLAFSLPPAPPIASLEIGFRPGALGK
jgi:hypothetical protein